jgi:hypothetical protein
MSALSKASSNTKYLSEAAEKMPEIIGRTGEGAYPVTVKDQIELVFAFAQLYLDGRETRGDNRNPVGAAAILLTVKPLFTQYVTMMNLLIRAGIEINGNPFLDEETVLEEIRGFLCQENISSVLPEAMFGLEPDQSEVLDELLGRDTDLLEDRTEKDMIAPSDIGKIGNVMLSRLIGSHLENAASPEWNWIQSNSSLEHFDDRNGVNNQFLVSVTDASDTLPMRLRPIFTEARVKGIAYLLFR